MHNKDRKYIYYEDKFGKVIGYLDELQPSDEDMVFVIVIAEKCIDAKGPDKDQWMVNNRDQKLAINLKKIKQRKFYENYEEFYAEFFEAIL